ncbi:MAG TPA: hypothetical protein VKU41_29615 [Polyangiaceae bacterium]|nr:hypothetical protein [Polyangiaceae bacterium]
MGSLLAPESVARLLQGSARLASRRDAKVAHDGRGWIGGPPGGEGIERSERADWSKEPCLPRVLPDAILLSVRRAAGSGTSMMPFSKLLGSALVIAGAAGCGSGSKTPTTSSTPSSDAFSISTPAVTVAAGEERYVCYAKTLDSDVSVDSFSYVGVPLVHHVFFSRAMAPETEGVTECDVLFKTTWAPLFVAGASAAKLDYPAGAASILKKGTQLVVQLHLLNASSKDGQPSVTIDMHRSTAANPSPVGLYAFGTQRISLAPNATGSVSYECAPNRDVTSFANFPHMHRLGTSVTLEVSDGAGGYRMAYSREPYDFNNQYLDSTTLHVPKGTMTRITCNYDNTTPAAVNYGESTNDEMCFLVVFMVGLSGEGGCVQGLNAPDDGGAPAGDGGSCTPTANAVGVGATCTAGGGECASGLSCTADLGTSKGPGFCLKVGCASSSECGDNATCCAPPQGGGIKACLPASCVPAGCM